MRYLEPVLEKIVAWFEGAPAARKALPVVSVALMVLGVVVMISSLSARDGAGPEATPSPTAKADLEKAITAAKDYASDQSKPTFAGFNPTTAEGTDASLTWNKSAAAVEGQVSIRAAVDNHVVLVSKDATGVFCAMVSVEGSTVQGRSDAQTAADCVGGW